MTRRHFLAQSAGGLALLPHALDGGRGPEDDTRLNHIPTQATLSKHPPAKPGL